LGRYWCTSRYCKEPWCFGLCGLTCLASCTDWCHNTYCISTLRCSVRGDRPGCRAHSWWARAPDRSFQI